MQMLSFDKRLFIYRNEIASEGKVSLFQSILYLLHLLNMYRNVLLLENIEGYDIEDKGIDSKAEKNSK